MKKLVLTLRTTIILIISITIITTSLILWLFFEKSQRSIHDRSLNNMANMLSFISYDAKWRILFPHEHDKSLSRYFMEEIWDRNENILWISIFKKASPYPILFRSKNKQHDYSMPLDIRLISEKMISEYSSSEEQPQFISRYNPEQYVKIFLYPVFGPDQNSTTPEDLLFDTPEQRPIIGYVSIGISIKQIIQERQRMLWKSIYTALIIMLIGVGIAFIITQYFTQDLTQIVRATQGVTKNNFRHPLSIQSTYKEIQNLEQAFNSMMQEIKELDNLKEKFLVNMSHELRTPLISIIGLSGAITKKNSIYIEDKYKQVLTTINAEANQLLNQIDPLVDLTKIEAGKMEINIDAIHLDLFLKDVQAYTYGLILNRKKPITLKTNLAADTDVINTDKDKLKNILNNLLSNAVKFTESGQIELTLRNNDNRIIFEVKDTGIGIKTEDIAKLFNRFQQVDSSLTRKEEGLGIGLALCKDYVQLLGGEMGVKSELGIGSCFYFYIINKTKP